MLADARELLGDLVVATVEGTYSERWLREAIATAAAVRAQPAPPDLLAQLREALDVPRLQLLAEEACYGTDWELACAHRSAVEAVRDLLGEVIDPSRLERAMIQHGRERYRPLPVPDDVPPWHWWWAAAGPPNEASLQLNPRMRALLPEWTGTSPPAADVVAPRFRELVARGFVEREGVLLFDHVLAMQRVMRWSDDRANNTLRLADVLPKDPSRRPVDLAAAALACARHLAYELQRRRLPHRRIVVVIGAGLNTLTFHRPVPVDLDRPDAMLVLDSA